MAKYCSKCKKKIGFLDKKYPCGGEILCSECFKKIDRLIVKVIDIIKSHDDDHPCLYGCPTAKSIKHENALQHCNIEIVSYE